MPDALRLALGTLTSIRVPSPEHIDRRTARQAMTLAPLVGLALGSLAAMVLDLVRLIAPGTRPQLGVDFVAAALAISALAYLTRGLHLDGLADTADGMGVKGSDDTATRARRLDVMRAPDIGAFGVITVVLTLIIQIAALTLCSVVGAGTVALILAVTTSRLAATWCCTPLVRAARADGLGALVAGAVPIRVAALLTAAVIALGVLLGLVDDDRNTRLVVALVIAAIAGLVVTAFAVRRFVSRFGGVTGDVMGAAVEICTTVVLLIVAIAA